MAAQWRDRRRDFDDDMSGMSIMLETARRLAAHKEQLQFTVRFVISDMEELGGLAGARNYAIVASYSTLQVKRNCIGANSDHFAMWEIGVPAVVYSEHNPFANPHFDRSGGDTFDRIDTAYLTAIARPAIAFQAALAGIPR